MLQTVMKAVVRNEGSVDDTKTNASTSSANEDTTVDIDHQNDVDFTTPDHLPIRNCDGNSNNEAASDGNQKLWCYSC